jgi:hypothetical protein
MRRGRVLALLLWACALVVVPALARAEMAAIEATAPLADESDGAIEMAITAAVRTAARGALAMGLPWVRVKGAYVREGYVGVQIIAMDAPPERDGAAPGATPDRFR